MSTGTSAKRILANAAIFIVLEIAALAILSKSSVLENIWLNRASHRVMAVLWGSVDDVRNAFSLVKQNEELMEQNAKLSKKIFEYQETESILQEMSAIAGKTDHTYKFIPATIVKMSTNTAHNYIILNKGSEDGVSPDSGIISSEGVIGIVTAVDSHYSYGLTLMNTNVSIGARVKSNKCLAPIVWDGKSSNGGYLKDIPLHYEVSPGDTVVTSGFSNIFPPDIPIGIAGSSTLVDGSVFYVKVTLFQDFSSVKYVTIVKNLDKEEIMALEAKEEGEL